jgi:multiple sugar transport system substrate-binding protein
VESCAAATGHKPEFEILPWEQYGARVFSEAASERPNVDAIMVAGHLWLPMLVENGRLAALQEVDSLQSAAYDAQDILPGVRAEMCVGGVQYLVPSFSDGHILYANRMPHGITDSAGRADVTRFHDTVRELRRDDPSRRPLILKCAPSEIFLDWLPYLRAFGGAFVAPDGEPLFDSPEGREAARVYAALASEIDPAYRPFGNGEVARAIREGEVDFAVSWGGQAGVIVPPASSRGGAERLGLRFATLTTPWNVTWAFGALAAGPRVAACAEVLAYLSSREVDTQIGVYAGSPSRASTYADPDLADRCPWFPAQLDLLRIARPLPPLVDLPERLGPISEALAAIVHEDAPVERALAGAARRISAL